MYDNVLVTEQDKPRFGNDLGYVRVEYSKTEDLNQCPPTSCKNFIYVIDTSASMCNGERLAKAKLGFQASCAMLDPCVTVTVIFFESHAQIIYSGLNPFYAPSQDENNQKSVMQKLLDKMRTGGGTNIIAALELTAAQVKQHLGENITVLLMTDGEDLEMSDVIVLDKDLAEEERSKWLDGVLKNVSGVQVHIVGISHDAASGDLAYLSQLTHGTFVCVKNNEIIDVMGTLLGLVEEKIPQAITLAVKLTTKDENRLLLKTRVPLIASKPSKIPFKIPLDMACESSRLNIQAILEVTPMGQETESASHSTIITQEKDLHIFKKYEDVVSQGAPHLECILEEAHRLWGEYNLKIAFNLRNFNKKSISKNIDLNRELMTQILDFKEYLFVMDCEQKTTASLQDELDHYVKQLQGQAADMRECVENSKRRLLAEQRALSDASTQRNCSLSLQNERRSMSNAQSDAVERIRSLSSTLVESFAGLRASSLADER